MKSVQVSLCVACLTVVTLADLFNVALPATPGVCQVCLLPGRLVAFEGRFTL